MIPKKIHYIWLSGEPLNSSAKACICSWKRYASVYEIKKWTMADFEKDELPVFVKEAIKCKKWAFACDYLRLYILEREGGIYLDSDVLMLSTPDEFLNNQFFSAVEYYADLFKENAAVVDAAGNAEKSLVRGMAVQAAVMGSIPHHPFVQECLKYYRERHFVNENGELSTQMLAPHIYALTARKFGFKYRNEEQFLESGIHLYPSEVFAPGVAEASRKSRMIHICNGSWREDNWMFRVNLAIKKWLRIEEIKRQKAKEKDNEDSDSSDPTYGKRFRRKSNHAAQ